MKQQINIYVSLTVFSLMISSSVFATTWTTENCTNQGGTIITANKYDPTNPSLDKGGHCNPNGLDCNAKQFCMSNKLMNWWSAITWCEAHGGQMAKWSSMCPETPYTASSCPNLATKARTGWPSYAYSRTIQDLPSTSHRLRVDIYNGGIARVQNPTWPIAALCE